jgi:hypothetical protein
LIDNVRNDSVFQGEELAVVDEELPVRVIELLEDEGPEHMKIDLERLYFTFVTYFLT